MKKNVKYIFLIMLMLFIKIPFLNADVLDCNYMFSPHGSLTDENNVKVSLKIDDTKKTISINNVVLANIYSGEGLTISDKVKVSDHYFVLGEPISFFVNENNNTKCPKLKFKFDTTKSSSTVKYGDSKNGEAVNLIKIYDSDGFYDDLGYLDTSLSQAILLEENNEISYCPKVEGTIGSTYYSIEEAASYLFDNDKYKKVLNVGICAYDNNVYYITVNGDTRFGDYVKDSPDNKGFLWDKSVSVSGSSVHLGIRESEWAELNEAFPYIKGTSKSDFNKKLRFSKIKNPYMEITTPMYILSIREVSDAISDSTVADSDYDVNMDPLFNFSISQNISDRVGFCVDYLGKASDDGTVANLIDELFDIAKIGSIMLVVILSMIECVSAITKDKDEIPNIVKKTIKRLIVLIIILLLPVFIDMVGNILGIEDILCGIK